MEENKDYKSGLEEKYKEGINKGMEFEDRKHSIRLYLLFRNNPNLNLGDVELMINLSDTDKNILQNNMPYGIDHVFLPILIREFVEDKKSGIQKLNCGVI